MASIANSYAALIGTSTKDNSAIDQELAKKKKKKNKNKKNKNSNDQAQNQTQDQGISYEEKQYEREGLGVGVGVGVDDHGGMPQEGVSVTEACRLLERQARDESLEQRNLLIQEWTSACVASGDEMSPGAAYAVSLEGQELTFRQVLIRSRTLEFLIEFLILHSPYRLNEAEETQRLIQAAFPAESLASIDVLMNTIRKLNEYNKQQQVSADVRNATIKAINLVVQSLKGAADKAQGGQDGNSHDWQRQVEVFDDRIRMIYPQYESLSKSMQTEATGAKAKELIDITQDLMDVCNEKFDVIMNVKDGGDTMPSVEVVGGTYESLDALHALTAKYMKAAQAQSQAQSTSSKREQLLLGFQQQQQQLEQQGIEVNSRIQSLEDELAGLRQQLNDIEQSKVELTTRRKAALDALNSGQKSAQGMSGMSVATCKGYEEAVYALRNCVKQAESTAIAMQSQSDMESPATTTQAPKQLLASIQYFVDAINMQMVELTKKVDWSLNKLARAVQLQQQMKQLHLGKGKDGKDSQVTDIQQMINQIMSEAKQFVDLATEAEESAKSKGPMLRVLPGFDVYRAHIQKIEQVAAQVRMKEQYIQEKIKNAEGNMRHGQKPARKKYTLEDILGPEHDPKQQQQSQQQQKQNVEASKQVPPPQPVEPAPVSQMETFVGTQVQQEPQPPIQQQYQPQPQPTMDYNTNVPQEVAPMQSSTMTSSMTAQSEMLERYQRLQQQMMIIQNEIQNLGSSMGGGGPMASAPMNGGASVTMNGGSQQPPQATQPPIEQPPPQQPAHIQPTQYQAQVEPPQPQSQSQNERVVQPPQQQGHTNGRVVGAPVQASPAPPPGTAGAPSWKTVAGGR
eukprot:TRINITY_DN1523_c0_g1_i3.p1 TRINITY_DN1523_c0_g1~~TRINITY_DN1523_c0_g1_i3.p1  ORF type:complete len:851 (-),score=184.57 TRINITY_DN1523_c0_g1_i3:468-3020(-)